MAEFEYLNGGNSEAQDKLATAYLLAQSSTGLARTGVLAGLVVSQTTTASGSVLIAAGAGTNQASVLVGASLLVNDTSKTLDIFTANPVGGLPRNDIVVFDATIPGLTVIVGTPNATPTDPTIPATVTALARLRHAASATTIPAAKIDALSTSTGLRGVMDAAVTGQRTTAVTGIHDLAFDGADILLVNAPTVTGDGVKRFKITASSGSMASTVAGDIFTLKIKADGTSIRTGLNTITSNGTADSKTLCVTHVPAAGTHAYIFTATRALGTGVGNVPASAADPIEIIVEQIA